MSSWQRVEEQAPELAAAVRRRFVAHPHLTMATLRRDGSPRISGTEVVFQGADLWVAGMPGSRKLADLRRDGRVAVHSGTDDPPGWTGDGKVAGRAVEVAEGRERDDVARALGQEPPGGFELFRIDVQEVVHVFLGEPADHLVIESWHEGRGVERVERR
ncbi:MAG: pyridoxamine 5'-phosphate oxidase family protein [Actinomycetota bacterium]|nr:pyridoxamine 5'-phosphate oxidase family protein [Actinomycetota bacterium]